jgi:large subunit ribosomal protein L3
MSAILAKKLGMTQVFQEDGSVHRVTVLQAGPCPITAIRTAERDGYDAVQLAFGQVKEKHLSKPETGHLRKADAPPMRHLAEFRDQAGELTLGGVVTVEAFEVGSRV